MLHRRSSAIADHWQRALFPTGFVALSTTEVHERLVSFVDRTVELLLHDPLDHPKAQALGADLARLYYADADALVRTQSVLAPEMLRGLPPQQRLELFPRLMALLGEMSGGFLRFSRQILLAEQESIRGALLVSRRKTREALYTSDARFRAVFDAAAVGMGVGDVDGRILEVNRALLTMLGYSAEEMRRMMVGQLTHPDDTASVWELYQALVEGQHDYFQTEKRYFRKDGGTIWCHLTVSLVRDAEGRPRYQIAMMENITERRQVEEALQRSEARFRALVQNASDVITILDADATVSFESPAIQRVLGYQPDELVGSNAFQLVHPDDLPPFSEAFDAALADPNVITTVEVRFHHKDGSWRWLSATCTNLLADPAVGGVVVNSRDITESKEIAAQLWHEAHHDSLTGRPNRVLLMDRLQRALNERGSAQVAVLFLDLDSFKVINDSLGHEYGDRLLVAVAERLASYLGARHLLARFGGDEFTVVQEDITGENEAIRMAERLQAALAAPFTLKGDKVIVTAGVGIVLSSAELPTPTDLLRAADVALYRAKANGKGSRAVFDPVRDAAALAQLNQERDLRLALERGELRLHYQPKTELATGRPVGVEALVRWEHPRYGLVVCHASSAGLGGTVWGGHGVRPYDWRCGPLDRSWQISPDRPLVFPGKFIHLAEETGLILPLGLWALEQSCRQVMAWRKRVAAAETLDLSVNVSPVQLRHPDLVAEVEGILRETGFPPDHLVLEITERGLVDTTEAIDHTIQALLARGIQLAIDDFGSYQAGLGYIRRWPVNIVKLDRTLVGELGRNDRSRAVVAAVVSLAKTLEMTVTGEGIESAEQLAMLRELGCDSGQGYYFSPPLPPDELAEFLLNGAPPSLRPVESIVPRSDVNDDPLH